MNIYKCLTVIAFALALSACGGGGGSPGTISGSGTTATTATTATAQNQRSKTHLLPIRTILLPVRVHERVHSLSHRPVFSGMRE